MTPEILFENRDYLICVKPTGCVTESTPDHKGLADLLADRNGGYIGVIHRLDRGVGGLVVFARTPSAAAFLSEAVRERRMEKEYVAVVSPAPTEPTGEWRDLLYFDRMKNKVYTVKTTRRGVKEAVLRYRVEEVFDLPGIGRAARVAVLPLTGRTHQIRVQFASRGFPVVGDRKYGGKPLLQKTEGGQILLACRELRIPGKAGIEVYRLPALPEGFSPTE